MATFTAPYVTCPDTAPEDPRIRHLLGRNLTDQDMPKLVIIGFPADGGVRRKKGVKKTPTPFSSRYFFAVCFETTRPYPISPFGLPLMQGFRVIVRALGS